MYELYRHLIQNGSPNSIEDFNNTYYGLIIAEKNARIVLPYSQRFNPNLTLHDANHSERVIEMINAIVDVIVDNGGSMSETEMEILYYSAWYHDLGILISYREYSQDRSDDGIHALNHAELSAEILRCYREDYFKVTNNRMEDLCEAVCRVVISHKNGFTGVPDVFIVDGTPVRLNLLCSILSLADLRDISPLRAPKMVYSLLSGKLNKERLDPEEDRHWIANISTDIQFSKHYPLIVVYYESEEKCGVILDAVRKYGPMHVENIRRFVECPLEFEYIKGDSSQ